MENIIVIVGTIAGALIIGSILGYYARQTIARKQAGTIEAKINKLIGDAKQEAKTTLLEAKEKASKLLYEAKQDERSRQNQLLKMEERILKREQSIDQTTAQLQTEKSNLKSKVQKVKQLKEGLDNLRQEQIATLEKTANLTQDQAKTELLSAVEKEHQETLFDKIKRLENEGQEELNKKAQKIIALAMQRYSASQASEITSTAVNLPNDDLKGRIIGKEGRNIKTLEKLTGVEILVDDTPGAIIISGFDPIRRQVAKIALEKLLIDGRIQPTRIEEAVEKANEEISKKIYEAGEAAVYDTGLVGINPQLIKVLGRLRFRTSYGQNVLLHSLEVAHLAGAIAAELGSDATIAKTAALFHDIGKAIDHEVEGSHVEIGRRILQKFNVDERAIEAMQAHHEEYPFESIESIIVKVADSISGARPGARKDTLEAYLKRLGDLENIANSFEGVEKSYAIQAGREIRVFVQPEQINDYSAYKLAKDIAHQVQEELKYPGEIKVNVIRETRAIEYAK